MSVKKSTTRKSTQEFINQVSLKHNYRYDYSLVNYQNNKGKVKIICKEHGIFEQKAYNHWRGDNCPECTGHRKVTTQKFIEKSIKIHGDKYSYLLVNYKNNSTKTNIICHIHGVFKQKPSKHLAGQGCPKCGIIKNATDQTLTLSEFIDAAMLKHNNFYDYSKTNYVTAKIKVEIICLRHGSFFQTPDSHKYHGCPRCINIISKPETAWLDKLNILPENRNIMLSGLGRKRVDGYDPTTNTVYEFHGDFWHGNPKVHNHNDLNKRAKKTFGELYQKTMNKENLIRKLGYNLVVMWENDFKYQ